MSLNKIAPGMAECKAVAKPSTQNIHALLLFTIDQCATRKTAIRIPTAMDKKAPSFMVRRNSSSCISARKAIISSFKSSLVISLSCASDSTRTTVSACFSSKPASRKRRVASSVSNVSVLMPCILANNNERGNRITE